MRSTGRPEPAERRRQPVEPGVWSKWPWLQHDRLDTPTPEKVSKVFDASFGLRPVSKRILSACAPPCHRHMGGEAVLGTGGVEHLAFLQGGGCKRWVPPRQRPQGETVGRSLVHESRMSTVLSQMLVMTTASTGSRGMTSSRNSGSSTKLLPRMEERRHLVHQASAILALVRGWDPRDCLTDRP